MLRGKVKDWDENFNPAQARDVTFEHEACLKKVVMSLGSGFGGVDSRGSGVKRKWKYVEPER